MGASMALNPVISSITSPSDFPSSPTVGSAATFSAALDAGNPVIASAALPGGLSFVLGGVSYQLGVNGGGALLYEAGALVQDAGRVAQVILGALEAGVVTAASLATAGLSAVTILGVLLTGQGSSTNPQQGFEDAIKVQQQLQAFVKAYPVSYDVGIIRGSITGITLIQDVGRRYTIASVQPDTGRLTRNEGVAADGSLTSLDGSKRLNIDGSTTVLIPPPTVAAPPFTAPPAVDTKVSDPARVASTPKSAEQLIHELVNLYKDQPQIWRDRLHTFLETYVSDAAKQATAVVQNPALLGKVEAEIVMFLLQANPNGNDTAKTAYTYMHSLLQQTNDSLNPVARARDIIANLGINDEEQALFNPILFNAITKGGASIADPSGITWIDQSRYIVNLVGTGGKAAAAAIWEDFAKAAAGKFVDEYAHGNGVTLTASQKEDFTNRAVNWVFSESVPALRAIADGTGITPDSTYNALQDALLGSNRNAVSGVAATLYAAVLANTGGVTPIQSGQKESIASYWTREYNNTTSPGGAPQPPEDPWDKVKQFIVATLKTAAFAIQRHPGTVGTVSALITGITGIVIGLNWQNLTTQNILNGTEANFMSQATAVLATESQNIKLLSSALANVIPTEDVLKGKDTASRQVAAKAYDDAYTTYRTAVLNFIDHLQGTKPIPNVDNPNNSLNIVDVVKKIKEKPNVTDAITATQLKQLDALSSQVLNLNNALSTADYQHTTLMNAFRNTDIALTNQELSKKTFEAAKGNNITDFTTRINSLTNANTALDQQLADAGTKLAGAQSSYNELQQSLTGGSAQTAFIQARAATIDSNPNNRAALGVWGGSGVLQGIAVDTVPRDPDTGDVAAPTSPEGFAFVIKLNGVAGAKISDGNGDLRPLTASEIKSGQDWLSAHNNEIPNRSTYLQSVWNTIGLPDLTQKVSDAKQVLDSSKTSYDTLVRDVPTEKANNNKSIETLQKQIDALKKQQAYIDTNSDTLIAGNFTRDSIETDPLNLGGVEVATDGPLPAGELAGITSTEIATLVQAGRSAEALSRITSDATKGRVDLLTGIGWLKAADPASANDPAVKAIVQFYADLKDLVTAPLTFREGDYRGHTVVNGELTNSPAPPTDVVDTVNKRNAAITGLDLSTSDGIIHALRAVIQIEPGRADLVAAYFKNRAVDLPAAGVLGAGVNDKVISDPSLILLTIPSTYKDPDTGVISNEFVNSDMFKALNASQSTLDTLSAVMKQFTIIPGSTELAVVAPVKWDPGAVSADFSKFTVDQPGKPVKPTPTPPGPPTPGDPTPPPPTPPGSYWQYDHAGPGNTTTFVTRNIAGGLTGSTYEWNPPAPTQLARYGFSGSSAGVDFYVDRWVDTGTADRYGEIYNYIGRTTLFSLPSQPAPGT